MPEDPWPRLCRLASEDDGLPTRKVGFWSEEKLIFWTRYLDITTRAMVGHPKWPAGLAYVDLFAGPGVCVLKESGRRIPGSPMIAVNTAKPFERVVVCERCPNLADACRQRLAAFGAGERTSVLEGDCNDLIDEVVRNLPRRALTLAFIDPTGLHARFETVAKLAQAGRVDLLILFADHHDIVRNVDRYEQQGPDSKLDQVLGPSVDWRRPWKNLVNRTPERIADFFSNLYKDQLASHLGYVEFGHKVMKSDRGPLYRIIYASKDPRGLDFWNKITRKGARGQRRLFE